MRGRKPSVDPGSDIVDLPISKARVPDPPPYLKGRARDEAWPMVSRILVAKNIYDDDVRELAAQWCQEWARRQEAEEHIAKHGTILKKKRIVGRGAAVKEVIEEGANDYIGVSQSAGDRLLRISAELGLTAVSRKRVAKVRGNGPSSAASKFLKAG